MWRSEGDFIDGDGHAECHINTRHVRYLWIVVCIVSISCAVFVLWRTYILFRRTTSRMRQLLIECAMLEAAMVVVSSIKVFSLGYIGKHTVVTIANAALFFIEVQLTYTYYWSWVQIALRHVALGRFVAEDHKRQDRLFTLVRILCGLSTLSPIGLLVVESITLRVRAARAEETEGEAAYTSALVYCGSHSAVLQLLLFAVHWVGMSSILAFVNVYLMRTHMKPIVAALAESVEASAARGARDPNMLTTYRKLERHVHSSALVGVQNIAIWWILVAVPWLRYRMSYAVPLIYVTIPIFAAQIAHQVAVPRSEGNEEHGDQASRRSRESEPRVVGLARPRSLPGRQLHVPGELFATRMCCSSSRVQRSILPESAVSVVPPPA